MTWIDNKKRAAWMLERYHATRDKRIELLGGSCSSCGTKEKLQFHHSDPATKELGISDKWDTTAVLDELDKCVLLCKSCHKKAHEAKHGTISRYRHYGCRCDDCVAVNSAYMKTIRNTASI